MRHHCSSSRPGSIHRLHLALFGSLTLFGLAVASAGNASPGPGPDCTASGDLVDVQIQVDGRVAPLYLAPGHFDRRYFQAFRGRNYSLVVRNNTGRRVGVLIAVDGLNVLNGEISNLSGQESMYVLDPYERAVIRGWRTSLDDVRRFVFVDEERSYAERSDKANGDMGWIRVLSFQEVGLPYLSEDHDSWRGPHPYPRAGREGNDGANRGSADASPPSAAPDAESRLKAESQRSRSDEASPGTGWGNRAHDPVNRTWFLAESQATDRFALRYEYASGLRALGIELNRRHVRLWERERGLFGFAQPPRW